MHKLYECGFGKAHKRPKSNRTEKPVFAFPYGDLLPLLTYDPEPLSRPSQESASTPSVPPPPPPPTPAVQWIRKAPEFPHIEVHPLEPFASWSILSEQHKGGLHELARQIVLRGPEDALGDVPRGTYGDLITVDRQEIESFHSVRALVRDYVEKGGTPALPNPEENTPEPLSIAVFGAPGSGKSTAVREVIQSLKIPGISIEFKEFNLSQFRDTRDMEDSLHLLRDDRLRGKVPLVLWDEFDTYFERKLGWLRYFLSPMQDGTFQQGQAVHPIGRSIFVFAGGISSSLTEFQSQPDFAQAKGPDFISRVRGVMELKGINETPGDPLYIVRRAVLLRGILKKETQLFERNPDPDDPRYEPIDPGVLDALLEIPAYRHGVRSMKAIVTTSSLSNQYYFGRSNLPTESQLNLHVIAKEFYAMMRRPIPLDLQPFPDLARIPAA